MVSSHVLHASLFGAGIAGVVEELAERPAAQLVDRTVRRPVRSSDFGVITTSGYPFIDSLARARRKYCDASPMDRAVRLYLFTDRKPPARRLFHVFCGDLDEEAEESCANVDTHQDPFRRRFCTSL